MRARGTPKPGVVNGTNQPIRTGRCRRGRRDGVGDGESVVERGGEATFQREGRTRRRGRGGAEGRGDGAGFRGRGRGRGREVFADGGGWRERRAETRRDGFGVIVYRGGRDGTREPRGSRRGRGRGRGRGRRRRRTRWAQLCVSVMNARATLEVRAAPRERRLAIREDARLLLGGETGLSGGRRRRVRPEGRRRARRRVVRRDCRRGREVGTPPLRQVRNLDIVPSDQPRRRRVPRARGVVPARGARPSARVTTFARHDPRARSECDEHRGISHRPPRELATVTTFRSIVETVI